MKLSTTKDPLIWDGANQPRRTFEQRLAAAAAKCGTDISDLKVLSVTIDNTWGHLQGYAFVGPQDLVERAAAYCVKVHASREGSYNCQNVTMDRGIRSIAVAVSTLREAGFTTQYPHGSECIKARCVSTDYFPCAE